MVSHQASRASQRPWTSASVGRVPDRLGRQVEDVAEVFLGTPGQGEVGQVVMVGQDGLEFVELFVGQVFDIAQ